MENDKIENVVNEEGTTQETAEEKTYTQEEVLKLIQAEADKRVTQALKTQEKKFEKKMSLSKLDDEARERAEKDDKIAELEAQLAEFQVAKNRSELKSVLAARGLSAEFADILTITDDLEASQSNIDKLDKLFKAAVRAEVEKRLAGSTPKAGGSSSTEITKETAKKMSMAEMNRLAVENPELFKKLFE